jgi:hypothetical protein
MTTADSNASHSAILPGKKYVLNALVFLKRKEAVFAYNSLSGLQSG